MTHSYFNSAFTTVADALASGNCTLISNAMVYKVLHGPRQQSRQGRSLHRSQHARAARNPCPRSRALRASAGIRAHPAELRDPPYSNGLANSSGVLGHYFTAHVRSAGGRGEFPSFGTKPSVQGGGPHKPFGMYIARFRNLKNAPPYKKFLRGFGYEGESSTEFNWDAPGFGAAYKKALLEPRNTSKSPASAKSSRAGRISLSSTPPSKTSTEFPSSKSTCPTAKTNAP